MKFRWALVFLASWATSGIAACGDDDGMIPDAGPDGGVLGTHPTFAPTADPMPFGAVPWPDDLYLDVDGRVALGTYPNEDQTLIPEYPQALRESMTHLDGFGLVAPAFFGIEGEIDPSSLPASTADSLLDEASAFMLDVDPGSPTTLERVPARAVWDARARRIVVRPADGHPLAPGRLYAAVLTTAIRDSMGMPLDPAPTFARLRDAENRPEDPLEAEIHERYTPVLASLASAGTPRETVAALAVFRTQTVTSGLDLAREAVHRVGAPTITIDEVLSDDALDVRLGVPEPYVSGLDAEGGVAHANIRWLIHGSFDAPNFLDAREGVHGRFERAEDGLIVKRMDRVTFSLALPMNAASAAMRPIVFQHGITAERSDMLGVADVLCAAGYAVIAIDAPYHGLRSQLGDNDVVNRFTGEEGPDGFGDNSGAAVIVDFAGLTEIRGDLIDFHPFYFRDALRQAVADLMSTVLALRESDWSVVGEEEDALAELRFSEEPVGFIGYSLGGIIGSMFVATEPDIGAAVLAVTGGSVIHLVAQSPSFNGAYIPQLFPLLGLSVDAIDYEDLHPSFYAEMGLWQMLFDRGDPVTYGPRLARSEANVLMMMARDDETVNNVNTESLARAANIPILDAPPAYVDLAMANVPLRGNATVGGLSLTRGLSVFEPATHGLLLYRNTRYNWEHPVAPPFVPREPPDEFEGPIDDAQRQMLNFFETWRSGAAEVAAPSALDV